MAVQPGPVWWVVVSVCCLAIGVILKKRLLLAFESLGSLQGLWQGP